MSMSWDASPRHEDGGMGDLINRGRRTKKTIDKPIPIDRNGFEEIDEFWGGMGGNEMTMSSPSNLTFASPGDSKVYGSPSPIRVSRPASGIEQTPPAFQYNSEIFQTPRRTTEEVRTPPVVEHKWLRRDKTSPFNKLDGLNEAIDMARQTATVFGATPEMVPEKPATVAPTTVSVAGRENSAAQRTRNEPATPKDEVGYQQQPPQQQQHRRTQQMVFSNDVPKFDSNREGFGAGYGGFRRGGGNRNVESPLWKTWQPPEEIEAPRRWVESPVNVADFRSDAPPLRGSESPVRQFRPQLGRTVRTEETGLDKTYRQPIVTAERNGEREEPARVMDFDRITDLSSDSDSDSDSNMGSVVPARYREPVHMGDGDSRPIRARKVERLSRMSRARASGNWNDETIRKVEHSFKESVEPHRGERYEANAYDARIGNRRKRDKGDTEIKKTGFFDPDEVEEGTKFFERRPLAPRVHISDDDKKRDSSHITWAQPTSFVISGNRDDIKTPVGSPVRDSVRLSTKTLIGSSEDTDVSPVRNSVGSSSETAIRSPLRNSVLSTKRNAVELSSDKTVRSPVRDSVLSPVRDSVLSPVRHSALSPVRDSVLSPVRDSALSPVRNSNGSPSENAVRSPIRDSNVPSGSVGSAQRHTVVTYAFGNSVSDSDDDTGDADSVVTMTRPDRRPLADFSFDRKPILSIEGADSSSTASQRETNNVFQYGMPDSDVSIPRTPLGSKYTSEIRDASVPSSPDDINVGISGENSPEVLRPSSTPPRHGFMEFEHGGDMGPPGQYEARRSDLDSPPPLPDMDDVDVTVPDSPPPSAVRTPPPSPKRPPRRRGPRQKVVPDYGDLDDIDKPIALRRRKRPQTKPLKFWKGEKIVYECDDEGLFTKRDVIEVKTTEKVKSQRQTKKDYSGDIEVLPTRVLPGETAETHVRYEGLANPVMSSNEFEIPPRQSMTFKATKERIVLHISYGKAKLKSHQQKWIIAAGGMIYISRGDSCRVTNKSKRNPVRMFHTLL